MNLVELAVDEKLISDSEREAFRVFTSMTEVSTPAERAECAVSFADILGNPGEFHQYVQGKSTERLARIDHLLHVFRENVELLVHKTWVEKTDEKRKEKLLEELSAFDREFREGSIVPAFKRFVALARSIAHLLFGAQSRADDFLVYCFRIDPKLGLFFWYVGELEAMSRDESLAVGHGLDDLLTIETLIGVYVLSSF